MGGMIVGNSSGQGYGNISYPVITPTKQMGMNPMRLVTGSGSWQVMPYPPSASKPLRSGLNDYDVASTDVMTKKTSEIR